MKANTCTQALTVGELLIQENEQLHVSSTFWFNKEQKERKKKKKKMLSGLSISSWLWVNILKYFLVSLKVIWMKKVIRGFI